MNPQTNEMVLLERRISHKKGLMETKAKEFNEHNTEAKRLQRLVEDLWCEIERDKRKLANLENKIPQPINY